VAPRAPRRADPRRHIFTQPWPAGPNGGRRDQVIYYQYRHDRARRILRGIEKTFRMAKSDLQARPIYHRKRDPIEAHLTIVLAALAVSRWIEARTGWSVRKFVKTARRYRTIQIQAGTHVMTAADPLPDDLRDALDRVHHDLSAH
jgi:hypothetical protein